MEEYSGPPLHPLATEAWGCLEEHDGTFILSPVAIAHFKEAIKNVKRMELRSALISFLTNADKLRRSNFKAAAQAMLDIALECCDAVAFDNEFTREQAREVQDMITARFETFGDRREKRQAPGIGAPRPADTRPATVFIRPPPRRRPTDR
jgi:hypothetical protein